MNFGRLNGKNPNPSNAPLALRSITRSFDKNGHRYADGNAGYDMVLAKEQNPNPLQGATLCNKMVTIPSFISDNGTMTICTPVRFGPWGGTGGTIFDNGIYTGVRQINLTRGLGMSSMKVLYDRNRQAIWGGKRGVSGTARPEKAMLLEPNFVEEHQKGRNDANLDRCCHPSYRDSENQTGAVFERTTQVSLQVACPCTNNQAVQHILYIQVAHNVQTSTSKWRDSNPGRMNFGADLAVQDNPKFRGS